MSRKSLSGNEATGSVFWDVTNVGDVEDAGDDGDAVEAAKDAVGGAEDDAVDGDGGAKDDEDDAWSREGRQER